MKNITDPHPFVTAPGELSDLIDAYDWSQTSLGERTAWSSDLDSTVRFILSSTLPLGIFWGQDLVLIYNDAWRSCIPHRHPEALGKPARVAFSETWEQIAPQFKQALQSTGPVRIEAYGLSGEKSGFDHDQYEANLSPVLLADGSPGGVLCTATRKSYQEQVEKERERLLLERTVVLDNLMESLTLAGPDGIVFYQNKASLALHGYKTMEEAELPKAQYSENWEVLDLQGKPVPVQDWPMPRALRGEDYSGYELSIRRMDGKVAFIGSYSGKLIKDVNGEPLFAVVIIRDITREKKAERELRNERELLQTIFDRIPIMLTIYDPQLEQFEINKHFERLTGWTEKDIQDVPLMERVYPDLEYRQQVSHYMQSLKPGFKDILMVTKDGKTLESSWANVKIPDGRQVGIGINLTDRIKAERALQRYSNRLQFLHEMDESILVAQSEQEIAQAVVRRLPALLPDCFRASVIMYDQKLRTLNMVARSDRDENNTDPGHIVWDTNVYNAIRDQLAKGKPFVINDLQTLPEESAIFESLRDPRVQSHIAFPIIIKNQLVGTLNLDMQNQKALSTEQKEIVNELLVPLTIGIEQIRLHERALEINRRLLEAIVNNIPVAVSLISGKTGRIILANPTYYDITPGKALLGSRLEEVWADSAYDYAQLCRQVLETNKPFFVEDDEVLLHRSPDQPPEKAYFSWWLFPVDIPDEQERGVLNMVYETTDRKIAETALVEAERLTTIGRMASSLAHEINNPIQSVVGCMGLAMESLEEGEDASEFMDVAMEELIRASRIIQRMRDLGRSSEEKKQLGNLHDVLEKVILLTQKQAQDQAVEVRYTPDARNPEILMVSDQIRQVFLNLILNAIEAMPDGGSLEISTRTTTATPGIEIQFKDTGIGILPEHVESLFEAFQSHKPSGMGLGLYVSRRIIKSHGGRIEVQSEVEKGTTFTIWLPASHQDNNKKG